MRKDLSEPLPWRWIINHSSHASSSRRQPTIGRVAASVQSGNHQHLNPVTVDAVHELNSQSTATQSMLTIDPDREKSSPTPMDKESSRRIQKDGMETAKMIPPTTHERLDLAGSLSTQIAFLEAQHRQLSQLLDEVVLSSNPNIS